jgi:DNA-binding LytR/AlgR family response regulator
MKSKKILIVEDELIIASDIEMTLEDLGYTVTKIVDNTTDALKSIQNNKPDLILLDINLEGDTDGVMLAEDINKLYQIPFVYLTSNTDPLTINRVKRTRPAGFIVKPFSDKDLQSNIEIALFSNNQITIDKKAKDFFIKDGSSLIKIKVDELLFVQADDNYTRFFTTTDEHLISLTLKKVSEKLSTNPFVRIHRSYIININFIDRIQDGYVFIGKHRLSIGRSYHENFFNQISKL